MRHPEFADGLRDIYSKQPDRHFTPVKNLAFLACTSIPSIEATGILYLGNLMGTNTPPSAVFACYALSAGLLALAVGSCIKNRQTVSTGYKSL